MKRNEQIIKSENVFLRTTADDNIVLGDTFKQFNRTTRNMFELLLAFRYEPYTLRDNGEEREITSKDMDSTLAGFGIDFPAPETRKLLATYAVAVITADQSAKFGPYLWNPNIKGGNKVTNPTKFHRLLQKVANGNLSITELVGKVKKDKNLQYDMGWVRNIANRLVKGKITILQAAKLEKENYPDPGAEAGAELRAIGIFPCLPAGQNSHHRVCWDLVIPRLKSSVTNESSHQKEINLLKESIAKKKVELGDDSKLYESFLEFVGNTKIVLRDWKKVSWQSRLSFKEVQKKRC